MAADKWKPYDSFMLEKTNGTQDLDTDVFKLVLTTSAYIPDSANDALYSALTGEVATGAGYTAGGIIVAATLAQTAGEITFDIADALWTAASGTITCRHGLLINSTTGGLVAYSLLDNTSGGTDVVALDTKSIKIAASNIFTETVAL